MLLKRFKENPQYFTIQYQRTIPSRTIPSEIEHNILRELAIEKEIILNKDIPLRSYNYNYIKDRLGNEYHQNFSLNTIIDRAKRHGFYLKKPKKSFHDREVLTHYAGELIQHDTSYHLWAPEAQEKCLPAAGRPDCSRQGISSPPWMITADLSFMPLWSGQKPVGPISWPSRASSFNTASLMPTTSIPTVSFDSFREKTPSGETITF
jgi:hypothetical protein